MAERICIIDDCENRVANVARGWCWKHYQRWRKHGDPLKTLRRDDMTLLERFHDSYRIAENGCWEWQRGLYGGGYGQMFERRKGHPAHRWGYEQLVGPVPANLDIDHLCRNRACVNPAHLEPVTRKENLRRGLNGVLKARVDG